MFPLPAEWVLDSALSLLSDTRTLIKSSHPLASLPSAPCLSLGQNLHPLMPGPRLWLMLMFAYWPQICALCRYRWTLILTTILNHHLHFISGKTEARKRLSHCLGSYRSQNWDSNVGMAPKSVLFFYVFPSLDIRIVSSVPISFLYPYRI